MGKLIRKTLVLTSSLATLVTTASAHGAGDYMMDGWTHNGSHMLGYGMWGMGWFGMLLGLGFWILAFLGAFFLYERLTEDGE